MWADSGNWDGGVPAATGDAVVDGDPGTDVTVTVATNATTGTLTVTSGDTVVVDNARILRLESGALTNDGVVRLDSTGSFTRFRLGDDLTFGGSGVLEMSNQTQNIVDGASTGLVLTQEADHTIRGSGNLGNSGLGLDNAGLIEAVGDAGLTVQLATLDALTRRNTGTLRATDGSTLTISQAEIDNDGGTFEAAFGGTFVISGATTRILGGTLIGDGAFALGGSAALVDVTNESTLGIGNGAIGRVEGTMLNDGRITVDSTGSFTRFRLIGDVTLDGSGVLQMSNEAQNIIEGSAGRTLTNMDDHSIRGAGVLGNTTIGFDNRGLIEAVGSAGLTVNPSSSADTTRINSGTMRATTGSTLTFNTGGVVDNDGGTIEAAAGGDVVLTGSATRIEGGTLTGAGAFFLRSNAVIADVFTDAEIIIEDGANGRMAGTVTNDGTISMQSTGSFTNLVLLGDTTLTGSGLLDLGNATQTRVYASPGDSVLTHGADHTIRGSSGNFGLSGNLTLNNLGTIEADGSVGLDLNLRSGETHVNAGSMRALTDSTLTLRNSFDNTGGLIAAADGGQVNLLSSATRIMGGTLDSDGSGVIRMSNSATLDGVTNLGRVEVLNGQTGRIAGNIINDGEIAIRAGTSVSGATLLVQGDTTLGGTGELVLEQEISGRRAQIYGSGNEPMLLTNAAGHTIRGEGHLGDIGGNPMGLRNEGLIEADGAFALTLNPNSALNPSVNTGTLRASGAGGMQLLGASFDNQGLIEAVDGSSVVFGSSATTANNQGGLLNGGQWRAAGDGSRLELRGPAIVNNNAEIILDGTGSELLSRSDVLTITALEASLADNFVGGTVRILGGRNYFTGNALTNRGTWELGGGDLNSAGFAQQGTSELFGFGTVAAPVTGTGIVRATGGTLTIAAGLDGGATAIVESDGVLDLGNAVVQPSTVATLDMRGGLLVFGPGGVTVSNDYDNVTFGEGNAFNRRANVVGAAPILGAGVNWTVGGDAMAAGPDAHVLDFGTLRGGTEATRSFTVESSGGAQIRGALQTAANGANIGDARLSGDGVTAQNIGPISSNDPAAFDVTFTANSGGDLTGQSLALVGNFDNLANQTIALQGFASALAEGAAAPSGPVDLGNFRVGLDGPEQSFAVENLTTGPGAERLGIAQTTATGNFAASNLLGTGLIEGGATQADAARVAVSGGVAGANSGTVQIDYLTDGTDFDAGFTAQAAGSETIAVSATGYRLAEANLSSTTFNIGPQREGDTPALGTVMITNAAPDDGFSEALNINVAGTTGGAVSNGGSVSQLGAGEASFLDIRVGVDTASAGAISGSVTLGLQSDGEGTSGLGVVDLAPQTVQVAGNVYRLAEAQLNTSPLNFGVVQVGTEVTQALSFTNAATGPDGFVEDLGVSFGAATGTGAGRISGAGGIGTLAAGATDASSMMVSVDTSSAGVVDGAIALNYLSTGTVGGAFTGLAALELPPGSFGVLGTIETLATVIDQAAPVIETPQPIEFGNVRIGSVVADATLSVRNAATGNDQAALNATVAGAGQVVASGSFDLLDPGAIDDTTLRVGISTAAAGAINGAATVEFVSDASNFGNCEPNCQLGLPSQQVAVTGAVYRLASPELDATPVDLVARRGDAAPGATIAITNASPDAFTEALDASPDAAPAGFVAGPGLTGLAAQATGGIDLMLDTGIAGSFGGIQQIDFVSSGAGTTGAADEALFTGTVAVSGRVYEAAQAQLDTSVLDFGTLRVGDETPFLGVGVSNVAPSAGLNDTLAAAITSLSNGVFGAPVGSVAGVGAGSSGDILVSLDTTAAGDFAGSGTVGFASQNPDMADLDLGTANFSITARVNNLVNPVFAFDSGTGLLSGGDTAFLFDFGNLMVGDTASATLNLFNDVVGPADAMHGSFDTSGVDMFGLSGFESFAGLLAGAGIGPLGVVFDAQTVGTVSQTLTLTGFGRNDTGPDLAFAPVTLTFQANVTDGQMPGVIPLPASLWLLLSGLGGLGLLRRRRMAG
ncbi:MAG: beta strand repeat-containing protein [Alkalilacustris sp.]